MRPWPYGKEQRTVRLACAPAYSSSRTASQLPTSAQRQQHLSHGKKTRGPLLSIESWLFNRDAYDGLLESLYNWVGCHPPMYPKQAWFFHCSFPCWVLSACRSNKKNLIFFQSWRFGSTNLPTKSTVFSRRKPGDTVDGRNPAPVEMYWYVVYPSIYKVLYIQTVVVWDFWTINVVPNPGKTSIFF